MNKLRIFKFKLVNFILQIWILSLLIYIIDYEFKVNFDKSISKERRDIIQFLANYIIFDFKNDLSGIFFIYISWFIISLIPILNFNDYKKAYSLNLTTFFFLNFFFYLFLYRYSPNYFNSYFQILFTRTIILGIFIILFSIGLSLLLNKTIRHKDVLQFEDLKKIVQKSIIKCPHCGTEFNSIPQYCYNCLKELRKDEIIND